MGDGPAQIGDGCFGIDLFKCGSRQLVLGQTEAVLLEGPTLFGDQLQSGFVIRWRVHLAEERPIRREFSDTGKAHGVVSESVKRICKARREKRHGGARIHAQEEEAETGHHFAFLHAER